MPKPLLKLDFANMLRGFDKNDNFFVHLLAPHYDVRIVDRPDFLFFTQEGDRHKLYDCVKIFYTQEPLSPPWQYCDAALTFDYPRHARAFRLPYYSYLSREASHFTEDYGWGGEGLVRGPDFSAEAELAKKTAFCTFMAGYENPSVRHRSDFFRALNARKAVLSGGSALNNIGGPIPREAKAKLDFLHQAKFHLAFENQQREGYVSEKITDAFLARTVPVYWGCPRITEEFNPKSFIRAADFPSNEALIDHLLKVDQDDSLYLSYLREPPFPGNKPNAAFDRAALLNFLADLFKHPDLKRPAPRRRLVYGRVR
jgi:hypothetical protein